ncbi:MAG: hypothetical protein Q4G43_00655 [Mobilicoccus sp.]|nr:hypothetical protein [Mobilicoccus sp.]
MIPAEVLDELYGGAPETFVAARTRRVEQARERGDKDAAAEIAELRKPTVAAWALNLVTRRHRAALQRLLVLGEDMRAAQADLDVDRLRDLRTEREKALIALAQVASQAVAAEGRSLSMGALSEIRATGVAALADAAAADALATGALVRTLDYAGFGEVDLSDAVAARIADGRPAISGEPSPDASSEDAASDGDARDRLRARLTEQLGEADLALAEASLVEAEAVRRHDKASTRTAELRRLLENAEQAEATSSAAAQDATAAREAAAAAHAALRRRLDLA